MQLRTVQWNIGGSHIREPGADPTVPDSYVHADPSYIADTLAQYRPDIVTLQETHADDAGSQARIISEKLGLPYVINDSYDNSHIDISQKLCQSIVSRFPISEHMFSFFLNPHFRKVMEDGSEWVSHDKGVSTAVLDIGGAELVLQTLHLIPFRKFDVDILDKAARDVAESVAMRIEKTKSPYLLQGDFNYHDIPAFLPDIFEHGLHEAGGHAPTTPKGRIYDHVFFRGLTPVADPLVDSNVLTDHYPVVSEFMHP